MQLLEAILQSLVTVGVICAAVAGVNLYAAAAAWLATHWMKA